MNQDLFIDWLKKFNEDVIAHHVTKPVILFVDRAKVHISIPAAEYCMSNGIYLYTLYPHLTHITQPLDLALMGSMKNAYFSEYESWAILNIGIDYSKYHFVDVFSKTYR